MSQDYLQPDISVCAIHPARIGVHVLDKVVSLAPVVTLPTLCDVQKRNNNGGGGDEQERNK